MSQSPHIPVLGVEMMRTVVDHSDQHRHLIKKYHLVLTGRLPPIHLRSFMQNLIGGLTAGLAHNDVRTL